MLNKSQVWSLACFLPGRAKDLSEPPHSVAESEQHSDETLSLCHLLPSRWR